MNKVTLIGNVVKELEWKTYYNSEGKGKYTKFTLAVNEYKHKDNNAVFINVVAFAKQAEVSSSLGKEAQGKSIAKFLRIMNNYKKRE